MCWERTPKSSTMDIKPREVQATWADASLLDALTGEPLPQMPLDQGVRRFVDWHRVSMDRKSPYWQKTLLGLELWMLLVLLWHLYLGMPNLLEIESVRLEHGCFQGIDEDHLRFVRMRCLCLRQS